ncbi:MAG: formate--tetrahydrofolate ligase [Clostridia bacterium]
MLSDIEIANQTEKQDIRKIAEKIGIEEGSLDLYGKYKAKVEYNLLKNGNSKEGKVILVTAINPTPAGEGKTTTTIGLADALSKIGKNTVIALREPSLGPVFGAKGGATGGGYAQVTPMEDINLHFTGDLHAIGTANNLLCALIDNHIKWGNELNIDPATITFRRSLDMNERQLRNIISGLGGKSHGSPREDGFDITVASEVMATFCLANDIFDLKERLGNIVIGYTYEEKPVTARDLKAHGAMTVLLKDALKPNLVQTLEGTPTFIHGGPFANIAHGCNSVIATNMARHFGDYVVTEAGFGADLGAEKFFDIKCRKAGIKPSAVVIVATIKALKYNGNVKKADLSTENVEALANGVRNLFKHVETVRDKFGLPCIVSINRFATDTDREVAFLATACKNMGVEISICESFAKGSEGGVDLAQKVLKTIDEVENNFRYIYEDDMSISDKIRTIAQEIYGADDVIFEMKALKKIERFTKLGFGNLPICMAKTQSSLTDDPTKLGRPQGFNITVRDMTLSAGAGFIVALTGTIMKMPGLLRQPAALEIDIDDKGNIIGLF